MPALYLSRDSLAVSLTNGHLVVSEYGPDGTRNPDSEREIRLGDISRVVVVGNPTATLPALLKLVDEGIPVFFVTEKGRWRGSLLPDNNRNAERRIRQYRRAGEMAFNRDAARATVSAKLRNARRVLQHLASNRPDIHPEDHDRIDGELTGWIRRCGEEEDLDSLRGLEGIGTARYFTVLGTHFPDAMPFGERSRRPPKNAANAVLSFAYTILLGEVEGCVRSHGLDAGIGNLHRDKTGSPALALDLMEPFRPALCDRLTLDLAGHGVLRPDEHFEVREDGGTYLNDAGRKLFFPAWERALTRTFLDDAGTRTDLRKEIDKTVCSYVRALENDDAFSYFRLG